MLTQARRIMPRAVAFGRLRDPTAASTPIQNPFMRDFGSRSHDRSGRLRHAKTSTAVAPETPTQHHVAASPPLSLKDRADILSLVEAYGWFWRNLRFHPELAQRAFSKEEVEPLLTEAAEYVVRIRKELDERSPGVKLRLRDGSAQQFLWHQADMGADPASDPQVFVRHLVHATFKDANGYVEGLSEARVDELMIGIKESKAAKPFHQRYETHSNGERGIDWQHCIADLARKVLEQAQSVPPSSDPNDPRWRSLCNSLESVSAALHEMQAKKSHSIEKSAESFEKTAKVEPNATTEATEEQRLITGKTAPKEEKESATRLQIKRISQDVQAARENLLGIGQQLLHWQKEAPDSEAAQAVVLGMQDHCVKLSQLLASDQQALQTLDAATPADRADKKEQLAAIYDVQFTLEDLVRKLEVLNKHVKLQQKKSQLAPASEPGPPAKVASAPAPAPAPAPAQAQASAKPVHEAPKDTTQTTPQAHEPHSTQEKPVDFRTRLRQLQQLGQDAALWSKQRLEPRFEVAETARAYLIQAFVPGMSSQDVSVELAGEAIVIKGQRTPSPAEVAVMLRELVEAIRHRRISEKDLAIPDDRLLASLGAGRFGSFVQSYTLPPVAVAENISATYENGVIAVTVPKREERHHFPHRNMGRHFRGW
eukprot:TRINITY_DN667_c1_g3_i1.p1 TRINITY_DN667_c1_g3~~TRINITY_DN667_c1_g3_i1.p1  ORF type:complete len:653 (-),score=104.42 TRINITY_DN667_c1_g3_i1:9-1967(-)